jgi:hypothetical protein
MNEEISECCGASAESNIENGWGQCSDCHEPARFLEPCPECGSTEVEFRHHRANSLAPECDYKACLVCEHQWDHS